MGFFELESLTDVWFVGFCSIVTRSDEGGQVGSWGVSMMVQSGTEGLLKLCWLARF